jgi:hypothetical protein
MALKVLKEQLVQVRKVQLVCKDFREPLAQEPKVHKDFKEYLVVEAVLATATK